MIEVNEKTKTLLAQIEKGKEEIAVIKAELAKKLHETFHGLTKELFITYPELKSFEWTQYTPYFNDGEECEFDANVDYPSFNGYNSDYDREGPAEWIDIEELSKTEIWDGNKRVVNPNYNKYYGEIITTVKLFLKQFSNDDYQSLFDNHVTVIVTAEGVKVEEYEHD